VRRCPQGNHRKCQTLIRSALIFDKKQARIITHAYAYAYAYAHVYAYAYAYAHAYACAYAYVWVFYS